ncbi:MAG TPA: CBS domain-containing protein [Pyrinomonadaceae bacterium]|nr:CBS domain-containing protein [Pyrinomonadaceae bacterium]
MSETIDCKPARSSPEHLTVLDSSSLREAMEELKQSGKGLVCVVNTKDEVVGVISDGDIRNALLATSDLNSCVSKYMTRDFTYAPEGASKEQVLKLLDSRVKQIPILDAKRRLVALAGAGYSFFTGDVYARAKSPARISFAGGGTDFTNYFVEYTGVSLSATIAKYSHVVIRKRKDRRITIHSLGENYYLEADSINDLAYGTPVDLIVATIKIMRPDFGLDLHCSCDYAPSSGLGGSAALSSALIGCLNEFREEKLDSYSIAEHSFEVERIELGFPGGWQDQYATVFGGLNYVEFNHQLNSVMPLRLTSNTLHELEERLLLCHTGRAHLGGQIQQKNSQRQTDEKMIAFGARAKEIALAMKAGLLRGNLGDFGRLLHETWELKKSLIADASSTDLDDIYETAIRSGADGGRLLGTGGGGYFLFCAPPFLRHRVWEALEKKGLVMESVVLDNVGMKSWTLRG